MRNTFDIIVFLKVCLGVFCVSACFISCAEIRQSPNQKIGLEYVETSVGNPSFVVN